ncbi:tetratricopeptide repeat protein [Streptomyces sp. CA-288835]|uniref:tetratricopeptide repeat protein n=1 Tax=Streptomyces sp. CA-288835 TaxID=3240069 RepID=UPI003D8A7087
MAGDNVAGRQHETILADVVPSTGYERNRYALNVITASPRDREQTREGKALSAWAGMSGAALLSVEGHHVLGVVVSDPHAYPGARIEATRAEALLADEEFRRLVGASADDLEGLPRHTFLAPAQRRLPAARTEVDLLLAAHAVVDYIPHISEAEASGPDPLDALTHWCEGEPVFRVAVLTGDGGSGKTRLATELCRTMSERGWQTGYLDTARPQAGWEIDGATLLVVDDVEYAAPAAGELLRQLAARPGGPPVRVLLVARRRAGSHWTIQLGTASDGVLERHTDLEIDLNAFCLSPTSRRRHVAEAARAFARTLGTAVPAWLPEVDDPEFANPLLTHALALLTVCGEHVDVGGDGRVREQVMRTLLHRERQRWESHRAVLGLGELADQRVQSAAVIVVTLTAPTEDEAVELLTAVRLFDDLGPGIRRRTATWLRDLFPSSPDDTDGRIRGPALDLIVEALLAEQDPVSTKDLLTRLCTTEATTGDRIAHALQVIRLAAENREAPREILHLFLEHHLRELVPRTLQPGGHRLASALSMSIAFTSTLDGVSAALLDSCLDAAKQLPPQRPGTAELAATLYDIYLTWLEHLSDRLAELPDSDLVDSDLADKAKPFRLAALHEAGLRYHEAGRWRDALSVLRRATEGYEELMEHNPERYREPFATALQNLGSVSMSSLKGKEQYAEAARVLERARVLYERLVEDDASAHSRRLAACLNNLSLCLLRLDRHEEAMVYGGRAAEIYEWLAASRHDEDAGSTGELANSLIALSMLYGERGLHAKAAECCRRAVDLCEQQAEEDDAIALRLAVALTELGRHHADLGRPSDGIACSRRAVEITRSRAEQLPEQFHHQLVDALSVLNRCYVNARRPGEALEHLQATMPLIEAMAETHPWRYLPALGNVQGLLAVVFDALGRDTTALHCAERAVEVSRQLSDQDPVVYLPVLAEDLRRLADRCRAAGRLSEAVDHARRSVQIRRHLSDAKPDRYLQELPDSLRTLAWVLRDTGMSPPAAACSEQAVAILRHLADRDPLRFRHLLAAQLSDHGVHCATVGLREEAFDAAEEAVELYEALAQRDPHLHRRDLAICLGNLGNRHRQLGEASSALPYCERAVGIWEELFTYEPGQFRSGLVGGLVNLSDCLAQLGRHEEGLPYSERALTLRQEVCEQEGRLGELALALPLKIHGRLLALVGRLEESLDAAMRVAEIYQGEYRARTSLQSEFPAALAWVADRQALLGQEREARGSHRLEVTIWMELAQRDAGFAGQLASAFRRYADTMERFGHVGAARQLRDTAAHHDLIAPRRAEQMVDLDDRFFIDSGWETVAVAIAAAQGGDTEAATWVDAFLVRRAQTSDWTPLASALQRVRRGDGNTDSDDLFAGLDPDDTLIVRRTLDLIRLPASERPVFTQGRADAAVVTAWRPNIESLLLAAQGQAEEDSGLEEFLTELDEDPLWTPLAARIRRFLTGERGPQLRTGLDPFGRAVISTLLTRAEEFIAEA